MSLKELLPGLCHRRKIVRCALAVALWVILSGCSGEPPPAAPSAAAAPAEVVATPVNAADRGARAVALANRGELALRAQQLFQPPESNAFELFLLAVELDPDNAFARTALNDLVPYAVLHVEQRTAAADLVDAERVLLQIQRASPEAPSLERLQRALSAAQQAAEQARDRATASATAAAAAVAPAAETAAPAPVTPIAPPPRPASTSAASPPTAASAAQQRVAPAADEPPPDAAAATVPASQPAVVFQPALRYPPQAQRRAIEGQVELEFTIGVDGNVSEVVIVRSEPEGIFDREAVGAMQRWRFEPPAAPMRAKRVLEFKLGQ